MVRTVVSHVRGERKDAPDPKVLSAAKQYLSDFRCDCERLRERFQAGEDRARAAELRRQMAAIAPDSPDDFSLETRAAAVLGRVVLRTPRAQQRDALNLEAHHLEIHAKASLERTANRDLVQSRHELRARIAKAGAKPQEAKRKLDGSKRREKQLEAELERLVGVSGEFARSKRRSLERELDKQREASAKIEAGLRKQETESTKECAALWQEEAAIAARIFDPIDGMDWS